MKQTPIKIEYYTDILCIWAFLAQVKIENLEQEFGAQIVVTHRYISLFGNNDVRIGQGWTDGPGGYQGYSKHVKQVVDKFDHLEVHPEIWVKNPSVSSLPAHLAIKAVQNLQGRGEIPVSDTARNAGPEAYALRLREAFFLKAKDIARHQVLMDEAEALGLPVEAIEDNLHSGQAHAALSLDLQDQRDKLLEGSPTFILNEGRQKLYGNIGYRAIAANIQELLDEPVDIPLWC